MKYIILVACVVGSGMARPDGAGGHGHHDHGHGHGHAAAPAAAAAAVAPTGGYQEPSYAAAAATGYETSGYAAASGGGEYAAATGGASGYESYGATGVGSGYGHSGYAVEETPAFNPSMLIIPILIIAGIALLFPTVKNVPVTQTAGRRKRSAEDEVSGNSVLEHVQNIYGALINSEECMERVACEIGGLVADAGISKDVFSLAAPYVPSKYGKMVKQFNSPKKCHKIKCGGF